MLGLDTVFLAGVKPRINIFGDSGINLVFRSVFRISTACLSISVCLSGAYAHAVFAAGTNVHIDIVRHKSGGIIFSYARGVNLPTVLVTDPRRFPPCATLW